MKYIPREEHSIKVMLRRPGIISVSGPPGIGKTRFLNHCKELVQRDPQIVSVYVDVNISFNSEREAQLEKACQTVKCLAEQLDREGCDFSKTLRLIERRSNLATGIASDTSVSTMLTRVGKTVKIFTPFLEGFAPLNYLAKSLSASQEEINALVIRYAKTVDYPLLYDPIKPLTQALIADWSKVSKFSQYVVLVDNLKLSTREFNSWIHTVMRKLRDSRKITWILTSWGELPEEYSHIPGSDFYPFRLERLSSSVIVDNDVLDATRFQAVKVTLGHFPEIKNERDEQTFLPLLVNTADIHSGSDSRACESLAKSIKTWFDDEVSFNRVLQLAATRHFDQAIAEYLIRIDNQTWDHFWEGCREQLVRWQPGPYFHFDSEIRYALLRYVQIQRSMDHYHTLHKPLVTFYSQKFPILAPESFELPHLMDVGSNLWSYFVEWFYHALSYYSSHIDSILIVGLQYAVFRVECREEINPLIDVIFQIAHERYEDNGFPNKVWLRQPKQISAWQTPSDNPPIYEKRFTAWAELLEECVERLTGQDPDMDWEPIRDFFGAITELHRDRKYGDRIAPEAAVEAYWRLAESYRQDADTGQQKMCYQEILEIVQKQQGDPWWDNLKKDAYEQLQYLEGGL